MPPQPTAKAHRGILLAPARKKPDISKIRYSLSSSKKGRRADNAPQMPEKKSTKPPRWHIFLQASFTESEISLAAEVWGIKADRA